jgi:hypothetical protein
MSRPPSKRADITPKTYTPGKKDIPRGGPARPGAASCRTPPPRGKLQSAVKRKWPGAK